LEAQDITYSVGLAKALSSKQLICHSVESCSANARSLLKELQDEYQQKIDVITQRLEPLVKLSNDYTIAAAQFLSGEEHFCPSPTFWRQINEQIYFYELEIEELRRQMRVDW